MEREINISEFDYPLDDEKIAKYPLERRDSSKLLIYENGTIRDSQFRNLTREIEPDSLFVFNNTKVIRARLIMHKDTGARIEVFCLEPHNPSDYERALAKEKEAEWSCIVGNLKRWKEGEVFIQFPLNETTYSLRASITKRGEREQIVRFMWDAPLCFGMLLEHLGRIPIPPYLNRESQEIDNTRYQTVYSRIEGSVAAPTAGLHFTEELLGSLESMGHTLGYVTLHVGAGTFLPVKDENAARHVMHTEHAEISFDTLRLIKEKKGRIIAVGTTSVRTLESLPALAFRIHQNASPKNEIAISQWEPYDIPSSYTLDDTLDDLMNYMQKKDLSRIRFSTQIMITPLKFHFRVVDNIITNFHQPKSTLLLLVSAFLDGDWKKVYDHALQSGYRFLSYGDSCLLKHYKH
ncbi:MAG: S-adenosylmethionine:tRNA ribosyltransferase-isomerase [Alistipes sp.]|nr:S-adenosylmethionine:tRNA ribosyltransferase-isomerase [Candidatus Alistipes equi]